MEIMKNELKVDDIDNIVMPLSFKTADPVLHNKHESSGVQALLLIILSKYESKLSECIKVIDKYLPADQMEEVSQIAAPNKLLARSSADTNFY